MLIPFLDPIRLPWPAPWPEIFGREAPLLVEVGFGGGHFLVNLARRRPEANVLGCEISLPSLRRGLQKRRQLGLANLQLVQGDARLVLWALCAPDEIDELTINFPDPWPKARHHERRLISGRFLHLAATRLRPDARLDIATDHAEYAAAIAACLAQTPYFDSRHSTPFVTDDRERLRTKYEQIALDEGRTCHYFKWRRNDVAAPNIFAVPKEVAMPHVILESPLGLAEIAAAFEPGQWSAGATHVRFIELFQSPTRNKLLIEANINEEPLQQRVGLTIRSRERNGHTAELILALHELGFPRPTEGVHQALAILADWLQSLHPDVKIVKSNLKRET